MYTAFKLAGAAMILVSSFVIGSCLASQFKRRARVTEAMLGTARLMRENIVHKNMVLYDAMSVSGESYKCDGGNIFTEFANNARTMGAYGTQGGENDGDIKEIWVQHVRDYCSNADLNKEKLVQALCDLGEIYTHVSTESISASLDVLIKHIEEAAAEYKEYADKNSGMAQKVSLACGALLIIVLY